MPLQPQEIYDGWQRHRQEGKLRAREIARELGVSEAQLVASAVGKEAVRLRGPWHEMVLALEPLGEVMALTRNDNAVIEKHGHYSNMQASPHMGQVVDKGIDLRLFFSAWSSGFVVRESGAKGERHSLQFFDAQGVAVHKVYVESAEGRAVLARLAEEKKSDNQSTSEEVQPARAPQATRPDDSVNVEELRTAWRAMKDTHEFFGLMRKFEIERVQALRLAGSELAFQVAPNVLASVLESVAKSDLPIMIFVSNGGAVQIHCGAVKRVKPLGPWLNILDDGFNLHVMADHISQAWVVKKPTQHGEIWSLELYDDQNREVALLFGLRKPDPQSPTWLANWQKLLTQLPRVS